MRTFTLLLEDGDNPRKIEFSGYDTSGAFGLLEREKSARKATLWEDDTRLGTIVRTEDEFWQISN